MNSRKGQTGIDIVTFIVVMFFLILLGFLAVTIWLRIDNNIQVADGLPAVSKTASSVAADRIPAGVDFAIIVALGLLYMGLYITTKRIGSNPMFFFINVILIILVLGIAAIFGNVMEGTNTAELVTERAAVPGLIFVANHLLEFAIGAMAIILIGLFSKPDS